MMLKFVGVRDAGNLERERIVLRAHSAGNPGDYLVLCTEGFENGLPLSGDAKSSYWLPDFQMAENDLLVIYSKAGLTSEKKNEKGRTTYFYYWREDRPIWLDSTVAVVIQVTTFSYHPIGRLAYEEEEGSE